MRAFILFSPFLLIGIASAQSDLTKIERIDASTPREIQIKLAEAAAPPEVSGKATILVLGKKGYETARAGTNGFTCMIEREITSTLEPECFDAESSATTLKVRMFVEEQRAAGMDEEKIKQQVEAGYKSGRFRAPRKTAIIYMLSPYNRVLDPQTKRIFPFPGHLMFTAPYVTRERSGSGKGAPFIVHPGKPDALLVVIPAQF